MDKAQLCKHFASADRRLRRADAREFLAELQRLCERELLEAGQFTVPGIAKLVVQERRARKGRNPVTADSGPNRSPIPAQIDQ
ncbi:MAG: HU family DNA-binding protein [Acidobacteria bacterium]|nr:HU family DNA-binding protein [Acidobacteriota bacterium]